MCWFFEDFLLNFFCHSLELHTIRIWTVTQLFRGWLWLELRKLLSHLVFRPYQSLKPVHFFLCIKTILINISSLFSSSCCWVELLRGLFWFKRSRLCKGLRVRPWAFPWVADAWVSFLQGVVILNDSRGKKFMLRACFRCASCLLLGRFFFFWIRSQFCQMSSRIYDLMFSGLVASWAIRI